MKWKPPDVIAAMVIIAATILLCKGIDTIVGWTLFGTVAAYYGIDLTPFFKIGRKQKSTEEKKESV